jgi:hypothetical protein
MLSSYISFGAQGSNTFQSTILASIKQETAVVLQISKHFHYQAALENFLHP